MNSVLIIAVIFTAFTACLKTSFAAPTVKMNTLPNMLTALIEDDSVPDPGIVNWFTKVFGAISKQISDGLADGDPEKIEKVRKYVDKYKAIVAPISSFIKKYYPNDGVANNIISAINTFLSQLDKMANGNTAAHQSAYMQQLANLMRKLESMD